MDTSIIQTFSSILLVSALIGLNFITNSYNAWCIVTKTVSRWKNLCRFCNHAHVKISQIIIHRGTKNTNSRACYHLYTCKIERENPTGNTNKVVTCRCNLKQQM